MIRLTKASAQTFRMLDVAIAGATLLFVAPLLLLTLGARLLARDRHSPSPDSLLYKSGIADLPLLIEVVEGRRSLYTPQPAVAAAARNEMPDRPRPPASREHRSQIISIPSAAETLGMHFRTIFGPAVSSDFDELLAAIDRRQQMMPRQARLS